MAQQYDLPNKKRVDLKPPERTPLPTPKPLPRVTSAEPAPAVRGDPRGLAGFIRETAQKYGISPDVALRVAQSEGLAQFYGDGGASGGAFQLYTKGGLGNEFQKETGLDPLDQKNEKATIDYALKRAAQDGWGAWYGAKRVGIGNFEGIAGDPTPNVGSGASAYIPETTTTAAVSDDDKKDEKKKKTSYGEAAGEGLEAIAKSMTEGAKANAARAAGPTTVAPPSLPIPMAPVPMVDPKMVEMQRQQLAAAMQRLNSGRLV